MTDPETLTDRVGLPRRGDWLAAVVVVLVFVFLLECPL